MNTSLCFCNYCSKVDPQVDLFLIDKLKNIKNSSLMVMLINQLMEKHRKMIQINNDVKSFSETKYHQPVKKKKTSNIRYHYFLLKSEID